MARPGTAVIVRAMRDLYAQAIAAQQSGNAAEAERLYRMLLDRAAMPEAHVNLGNLLTRQGRPAEALEQYDRALALRGGFFEALFNRANLLSDLRRAEAALADYDAAAALRPDVPGLWNNRGTALRALRRQEAALESYDRALRLAPGHVNALTNRAMLLLEMDRPGDALASAEKALTVQPRFAEALYVRANALRDLGRWNDALAACEAALEAAPGHPHALNGLARAALTLCDWRRAALLAPALRDAVLGGGAVIQPFVLMGYSDDAALLRRCAEQYVHRVAPAQPPLSDGRRCGHGRIRLAYLSADFHSHPTAQLMAELFERHDRNRFEVSAYAFGPDDGSTMRARLVKAFDRFEDVRGLGDAEVARLLRERETDIAIDLNTHTHGARPGIFALKPAPVQVNYLVYPGTSGASYMDYILADAVVLPPGQQPFFSEKIVHLPHCYQANDATRLVAPAPPRGELGLPEDGFVFCCLSNGWKITAPLFDIWMRLLEQVPGSVLWLLDGPQRDTLKAEATARGIAPARLVFAPKAPPEVHLARHQAADLFLDTLPYDAHTSASDALWAGLPLVTCTGKAFQGRVAASLLEAIGLPELIAPDLARYETLALDLAREPALLRATREKLARNRLTMPLYDSARFRRDIEAAYEAMLG